MAIYDDSYRIAGNFRVVQNFAIFADRSRSAKIKTTKIFVMRMRKGEGGSTLRTAGTGLKWALYRYATSHQQANGQSFKPQLTPGNLALGCASLSVNVEVVGSSRCR